MESRKYTSELRDAQATATKERILNAVVEVLAEGVDTLSIPAVAKRAGVSIGTVYRHFGDKSGLLKALIPHAARTTGTQIDSIPESLDEFDDVVHRVFHHFEKTDDLLRAAFASRIGREARLKGTAERLSSINEMFQQISPHLSADELDHIARVALILTTSEAYQQWRDRLELSPDQAADEVVWAIKAVLRGIDP